MAKKAQVEQGYWSNSLSPAKLKFIGAYIETCSISEACRAAQVPRTTHYHWLATDPVYRDEYFNAKPLVAERLEDEAVRRGFKGILKPVTIAGEREEILEYDSGLLKMLLVAHNPERFRQRIEQTNLMDIDPDKLSPEMLDKIAEHLIAKALGANATPETVADTKRRLEAGETVTVDAVCEDVTEKPE